MADFLRPCVQKLNGENYSIWSQKMELLLIREDSWDVIKEEMPEPRLYTWSKRDDKARARIGLLVEDNHLLHMQGATTAREAWDKLKG